MKLFLLGIAASFSISAIADYKILRQYSGRSYGVAISENGNVLAELEPGALSSGNVTQMAGLWNPDKGTLKIGKPLPGFTAAHATGINNAGEAVGFSDRVQNPHFHATLWKATGEEVALPLFKTDWASVALAMADDIIVGFSLGEGNRPVAWLRVSGEWQVEELPRKNDITQARAVSPDGKIVVGVDGGYPVRWTKLPDGKWNEEFLSPEYGIALAVNNVGTITGFFNGLAVINGENVATHEAFVLGTNGFTKLGFLTGHFLSRAVGVTAKGEVVGHSRNLQDGEPFVWTKERGLQKLGQYPDIGEIKAVNSSGKITGTAFRGEEPVVYVADLP